MRINLLGIFFILVIASGLNAQMQYMGLQAEANVREAQLQLASSGAYWPKTQVIDNYLYIPTSSGLYRKNLNSYNDTLWDLYAFPDIPIKDFVKKNDSILAITAFTTDSLLLLSVDDGQTYTNFTSEHFFEYEDYNAMWNMDQNPLNPNSIIVLHANYGISRSTDFGNTWTSLQLWVGGYQDWFIGYNPLDTNSLYYTGEQMFYDSYIQVSLDNGQSWTLTCDIPNHATHILAFHPSDTNNVISGGEGFIGKSNDRGLSWTYMDTLPIYITDIKYDPNSSNILYATGDFNGYNDTIKIYRSIDGGEHWNLFYTEVIENSDGALELHIQNDKLFLYTMVNGVYMLDLDELVSVSELKEPTSLEVFPNPSKGSLCYRSEKIVDELSILDLQGRLLLKQWPKEKMQKIDCAELDNGSYILVFRIENAIVKKKIIIQK